MADLSCGTRLGFVLGGEYDSLVAVLWLFMALLGQTKVEKSAVFVASLFQWASFRWFSNDWWLFRWRISTRVS